MILHVVFQVLEIIRKMWWIRNLNNLNFKLLKLFRVLKELRNKKFWEITTLKENQNSNWLLVMRNIHFVNLKIREIHLALLPMVVSNVSTMLKNTQIRLNLFTIPLKKLLSFATVNLTALFLSSKTLSQK